MQIAERRGGRDVVLEHLGSARGDAEIAALMKVARDKVHPAQGELALDDPDGSSGSAIITSKSCALLWEALTSAYAELGFEVLGDEGFKQMVLARLVEPTSQADTVRVLDELGVAHVWLRTMFRALERAQKRDYRDRVARACFTHAAAHGDLTLILYDVTTLYFEVEHEDELRRVGYSKERRVDPQIVVGLLVDRGGFPLDVTCWEGNYAETRTLLPSVRAFQKRHNIADMVIVADAGMLSVDNLNELHEAGLRFIVGSRQTKAPGDLAKHFHWNGNHFTDGQIVDTLSRKHNRSASENDLAKRAEPVWDPEEHPKSWRAIWQFSKKRDARDRYTLTKQENRARAIVEGDKNPKGTRFVTTSKGTAVLDTKSLERAYGLAGLKGYVCNITAEQMPPAEVIANYHDLWHVEQSFRMSKTDLRARPILHHTKAAIEAHLTVVMTALAVARHLQKRTGMSIKKIVRTLRPHQQITVRIAGHEHTASDPLTPQAQEILTATGTTWPTH